MGPALMHSSRPNRTSTFALSMAWYRIASRTLSLKVLAQAQPRHGILTLMSKSTDVAQATAAVIRLWHRLSSLSWQRGAYSQQVHVNVEGMSIAFLAAACPGLAACPFCPPL